MRTTGSVDPILYRTINRVWNAIAADALACGRMSNAAAVECCIDADRLTSFGGNDGAAAEAALKAMLAKANYATVLRRLAREIKLEC